MFEKTSFPFLTMSFKGWVLSGTTFLGSWKIDRKTLWVLRVSFRHVSTCSYQWSPAVPLVPCCDCHALATMARSISWALPPRDMSPCLQEHRSSLRAHMKPVLDIAALMCWGIGLLGSLNMSGASVPAPVRPPGSLWSPLDLTPFSFFLRFGGFRVCKGHEFLEPHYHRLKRFFQEADSVFRDRKGEQGGIYWALVYLLILAVKGPLQTFSSILFKDLMQQVCLGLCFIFPQSISVVI